jgi:hypothetical protein
MAKEKENLSFRLLLPEQRRKLFELSEALGLSPDLAARQLVADALDRPEAYTQRLQSLENQLYELREEVRRLAQDQMTSVRELLVRAGKLSGPDAHRWVEKNLVEPYHEDSG